MCADDNRNNEDINFGNICPVTFICTQLNIGQKTVSSFISSPMIVSSKILQLTQYNVHKAHNVS